MQTPVSRASLQLSLAGRVDKQEVQKNGRTASTPSCSSMAGCTPQLRVAGKPINYCLGFFHGGLLDSSIGTNIAISNFVEGFMNNKFSKYLDIKSC